MNLVTMDGEVVGTHWRDLASLLPMYRAVTTCEVRDGLSTAFWEDRWLSMGTLKDLFPLLYTHATTKDITVAMAVEGGLERYLVPRLTARAAAELEQLRQILTRVRLCPGDDRRSSPLCDAEGVLRAGPAYQLSMHGGGRGATVRLPRFRLGEQSSPEGPVLCLATRARTHTVSSKSPEEECGAGCNL